MTELEGLHITAKVLRKEAQDIEQALSNPDIGIRALAFIVADAGALAYRYNNLRVDINRFREKSQRNAINPDS